MKTLATSRSFGRETKFQKVRAELELLVNRMGAHEKLPALRELATEMATGINTLSGVLDELEAQNLIYRRHGVGVFVSPYRTKAVALVCSPHYLKSASHSPFWDILLEQARTRAAQKNEAFEIHFAQGQNTIGAPLQRGLSRELESGQIDGIIGIELLEHAITWIEAQKVPFVSLFGPGQFPVWLDEENLIKRGVEELQKRGCERIGLWAPVAPGRPRNARDVYNKEPYFRTALQKCGLEFRADLLDLNHHLTPRIDDETKLSHQEQGFETARRVFGGPRAAWPDGVIIADDMMAHGALMALPKLEVEIGRDVEIASHSNRGSAALLSQEKGLILLEFDPAELVQRTFEVLETLMSGQKPAQPATYLQPQVRFGT